MWDVVSRSSSADIQSVNTEEVVWLLGYWDNLWIHLKRFLSQSCLMDLTCSAMGAISELLFTLSAKMRDSAFASRLLFFTAFSSGVALGRWAPSNVKKCSVQLVLTDNVAFIKCHVITQRMVCYIKMAAPEEEGNLVKLLMYIDGGFCRTFLTSLRDHG